MGITLKLLQGKARAEDMACKYLLAAIGDHVAHCPECQEKMKDLLQIPGLAKYVEQFKGGLDDAKKSA